MEINVKGSADLRQMQAAFAAMQSQIQEMNVALAETGKIPMGGTAKGFAQIQRSANATTAAFNNTLAASGAYRVEQIKINDAVAEHTKLLQNQKLKFNQVFGKQSQDMMKAVYREQLALQRATVRTTTGGIGDGTMKASIAVPTAVSKSWDDLNAKVGFFRARLASASSELINWGKNTQWAGRQLMAGISMPVAAFGAAAGVMAYQVDKAQQSIIKVYDYSAAAQDNAAQKEKEVDDLRTKSMQNANDLAKQYGATILSTLDVQQQLAATGLRGNDLFSTTSEVQRISRLGDIDPNEAVKMIVSLKTAFRDTIPDAKSLTDTLNFMNEVSNKTSLSLQDIAAATPKAASALSSLGVSAKEMTVLMVSMRESGVNANEAANALKSASTRILNPVKKAIDIYDQYGISLKSISEESGGNLMKFLQLLGVQQQKIQGPTEKQTKFLRAQGIAALFGTYQYNRLNASLVNLGDAYGGVQNQSAAALQTMQETPEQMAKAAADAQARLAQSASGQWKTALAEMQAALAQMGDPFLEVATKFLKFTKTVLNFVNGLPNWAKKGIIFGAMLAALVGPVVMLVGLFANFAGNIGKFGASLLKFASNFEIVTKSQIAGRVSAELAAKALASEVTEAERLAVAMDAVTEAVQASSAAMVEMVNLQGGKMTLPQSIQQAISDRESAKNPGAPLPARPTINPIKTPVYTPQPFVPLERDGKITNTLVSQSGQMKEITKLEKESEASYQARNAAAKALWEKEQARLVTENDMVRKSEAELGIREKTKTSISGAGVAMGVMGASMATMMITSNSVANDIAKWAMISSIVVPALKTAALGGSKLVDNFTKAASAAMLSAKNTASIGVEVAGAAGKAATLRAGIGGAAAGFSEMIGPVGWIGLGITTIGAGLLLWKKHIDDINAKQQELFDAQDRSNKALTETAANFADSIGRAVGSYNHMIAFTPQGGAATDTTDTGKAYDYYKNNDQGKNEAQTFIDSKDDPTALMAKIQQEFIDMQQIGGASAEQAKAQIQGLFLAIGKDSAYAQVNAQKVYDTLGDIKDLDWSKAIENASKVAQDMFQTTGATKNLGFNFTMDGGGNLVEDLDKDKKIFDDTLSSIQGQINEAAGQFSTAWVTAMNPKQAADAMNTYMKAALNQFQISFDQMMSNPTLAALLTGKGITDAKGLANAFDTGALSGNDIQNAAANLPSGSNMPGDAGYFNSAQMTQNLTNAQDYEKAWIGAAAASTSLGDGVQTTADAVAALAKQGKALTFKEAQKEAQALAGDIYDANGNVDATKESIALANLQLLGSSKNIKRADTLAGELYNIMHGIKNDTQGAADAAGALADNVGKIGNVKLSFSDANMLDIQKSGMSGVESDLSDMISNDFEKRMNAAEDNASKMWDKRISDLQQQQQNASDKLDRQQQDATDAFTKRWDRRKQAVSDAYDAQVKQVDKEIKAEQAADAIRQSIFEAEQNRLDRLSETANNTIDFNMALQTGNLDEAAKLRNDMDAAAQKWALSDAASQDSTASQRRQDQLQKQEDHLGNQKDKALKALQDQEDAEQKSLERRQAQEKKHLEKIQAMTLKSLQDQSDAQQAALKEQWDARKANLDGQLQMFQSFVPKNEKQLRDWMDQMGIDYDHFGLDVLKPNSERWGSWYKKSLTDNVRAAGVSIASDNMWTSMGKQVADKTLAGMGFSSMGKFSKFIATGELPKDFGKVKSDNKPDTPGTGNSFSHMGNHNLGLAPGQVPSNHAGGIVGQVDNRKGVARNLALGTGPGERLINAMDGEFVVNKDMASKHHDVLQSINNNTYNTRHGIMGGIGTSTSPGFAGLMAGVLGPMLATGLSRALQNATANKMAQSIVSTITGTFAGPGAGTYGDITFGADQIKNATIIANVGKSMGMSARDIEIGLMTAIDESMLQNLHGGDLDSQGLFQQRPSAGWGSPAQVTDPQYAARKFFEALKGITDRANMSPWMAAQSVQRSATLDGSNYERYWDNAKAIFAALGQTQPGKGFTMGPGGRHIPVGGTGGHGDKHDEYTGYPAIDFPRPVGTPIYAVADGRISKSEDITSGGTIGNGLYNAPNGLPYRSYGKVIYLKTNMGPEVLYAHLSRSSVSVGQNVTGGSILGATGNTGNSTGPHLHFGSKGASPLAWLKTGGMTINDGMAMLHKGETVLTKPLTEDLKTMVKAFGAAAKASMSKKPSSSKNKKLHTHRIPDGPNDTSESWGPETTMVDPTGSADLWTYVNNMSTNPFKINTNSASTSPIPNVSVSDVGKAMNLRQGTLNTLVSTPAAQTIADLDKLMRQTDILTLSEMNHKVGAVAKAIAKNGWGMWSGGKNTGVRDAVIAYNKAKLDLVAGSTQKLGDKTDPTILGGKYKRYANYGLFRDKASGREFWEISAHTVPTPNFNKTHRDLFFEQWKAVDDLVTSLKATGAPVFMGGDVNERTDRPWWRTPKGLAGQAGVGVDWLFSDPTMAQLTGHGLIKGMHTDHAGAYVANYNIPSHKDGAQNIRWDNTLVNMHKGEGILTEEQNAKFRNLANNIDNVAGGRGNEYNLTVQVTGTNASADEIATKVMTSLRKMESRKPTKRRS